MRIPIVVRAAAVLAVLSSSLPAQSVGKMVETDLRNFGGDIWSVWTSPFRASGRDWLTAGLAIGGSAAASIVDDDVDRWMVSNSTNPAWGAIKELREGGVAFSGKYVTPVAGGLFIYSLATKNTKIQEGIFGCLASYTAGSVVRNYVIYYLVGRERPDSSREDAINSPPAADGDQYNFTFPGKKQWGMHSMPAGHAANIVACASFLGNRFDMGYVEPALYALSAGIGVGRLVDRRHWTSDTMIGMIFGYAIGREVAHRSTLRAERSSGGAMGAAASAARGVYFTPGLKGATLGWRTTF